MSDDVADLRQVPSFKSMSDDARATIDAASRRVALKRGDFLFRQGDRDAQAYVVLAGRLRLIQHTDGGVDVTIDIFGPGELLSLISGVSAHPHSASCQALKPARVMVLPATLLIELLTASPEAARHVLSALLTRLRDMQDRVRELAAEDAERRIARAVMRLADKTGQPTGGKGIHLDVPVTRQMLAELSATTLHTASRTLSAWHRAGWVFAGRETLTLLHPEALQAVAEAGT
jgi:CRP/FNR family transcriptional regulator, nitrogen oxide reductase regulator